MMRIERMQEPLQLPRRLHFLGSAASSLSRRAPKMQQFSALPQFLRALAAAARGRPALAVAPVLDASLN